jgi:hypothetical protein
MNILTIVNKNKVSKQKVACIESETEKQGAVV